MQAYARPERAAVVLAAAALLYSVLISLTGQIWVVESTEGSSQLRQFNPATLIPVAGAIAALFYARKRDSRSVWIIGISLLVLSALFVFSFILVFAPTALAVLASATLLTISSRTTKPDRKPY